jgi:hypothetical protein
VYGIQLACTSANVAPRVRWIQSVVALILRHIGNEIGAAERSRGDFVETQLGRALKPGGSSSDLMKILNRPAQRLTR